MDRAPSRYSQHDGETFLGDVVKYGVACGTGAAVASGLALVAAAQIEGRSVTQPFNATSHWLWGQEAGRRTDVSAAYTGTGVATNVAASMFWGAIFATHLAARPRHSTGQILRDAAVMGGIATVVDYGLVPKRLTPGWELALPKRSVGFTMAAMAMGLAAGALLARGQTGD
jgi:hypothetical protein